MDEAKRKVFVERLSRALGRESSMCPSYVEGFDYSNGPQATMYQDLNRDEVIAMFKAECDKNGTKYCNTTPEKLGETLISVIEEWGNGKVIYPNAPEIEQYGLKAVFENDNNDARTFIEWNAAKGREENIAQTQDADVGITFPLGGIAETATVVQASDAGTGRSISLLPNTHIAILRADSIMPRMTQTMEMLTEKFKEDPANFASNVVLISGPSNTADIELIRVNGAHGPLQVTYILVD